jgi:uncharacterized membrane protein
VRAFAICGHTPLVAAAHHRMLERGMNTLSVWCFRDPAAAERLVCRLDDTAGNDRVTVDDAAFVAWPSGRRTPVTHELGSITGPGKLWGGFWGMLLGLIFLTPLAGPTFGAAAGAVAGSFSEFGVSDDFVMRVRQEVTPGTSAIFTLSTRASARLIAEAFEGTGVSVLASELSVEQEELLREALSDR